MNVPQRHAYLVDGIRTPFGRAGGALAGWHPADLGAKTLLELVRRTAIDPGRVDDVIFGCVNQIGPQTSCIARTAWLTGGLPASVPGVTVDRRCGSSLQAVHFAAQAVMSGMADVVIAGGVESMTMVPIGSPRRAFDPTQSGPMRGPFDTKAWIDRFGAGEPSQFAGSDMLADRWGLDRESLDELSAQSHQRAAGAWSKGFFDDEVIGVGDLRRDEGVRETVDRSKMASLQPLLPGGMTTAAMSSQLSDGAAVVLVASAAAVEVHGWQPLARFHTLTVAADDPVIMLTAPIAATRKAFERSGLGPLEIGVAEVNEAFAPVVLACARELGLSNDVVNVNGGAIAIGHPLGATGARLALTLAREMVNRRVSYGLATMCEAGGQANTIVLERVGV